MLKTMCAEKLRKSMIYYYYYYMIIYKTDYSIVLYSIHTE